MSKSILFLMFLSTILPLSLSVSFTYKALEKNENETIQLPDPVRTGGMNLYKVMNNRKSQRDFVDAEENDLSMEQLSQMLWLAYGPNRENNYKTVPSAVMAFPFDVYVFLRSGVYKYTYNQLELVIKRDFRAITGMDEYVASANANFCFVGFFDREKSTTDINQKAYMMQWDSGYMAHNMYLYCAEQNFKCVTRANINNKAILQILGLDSSKNYVPLCFSAGK